MNFRQDLETGRDEGEAKRAKEEEGATNMMFNPLQLTASDKVRLCKVQHSLKGASYNFPCRQQHQRKTE